MLHTGAAPGQQAPLRAAAQRLPE